MFESPPQWAVQPRAIHRFRVLWEELMNSCWATGTAKLPSSSPGLESPLEQLPEGLNFPVSCCAALILLHVSKGWWKSVPLWFCVRSSPCPAPVPASSAASPSPDVQVAAESSPPWAQVLLSFKKKVSVAQQVLGKCKTACSNRETAAPWGQARRTGHSRTLAVAGLGKGQLQHTALNLPGKAALPGEVRCGEAKIIFRELYLV